MVTHNTLNILYLDDFWNSHLEDSFFVANVYHNEQFSCGL